MGKPLEVGWLRWKDRLVGGLSEREKWRRRASFFVIVLFCGRGEKDGILFVCLFVC